MEPILERGRIILQGPDDERVAQSDWLEVVVLPTDLFFQGVAGADVDAWQGKVNYSVGIGDTQH